MSAISIRSVRKDFKGHQALKSIELEVLDREFCVLLGPSGCGKTTLMRIIAGLEEATEGEVWIGERRVDALPPRQRRIAMVFQNYALYPHKTVRQNLSFPLRMAKVPAAEQTQRVDEIATVLELTPLLDRFPRQLSGGQRQRVAMGRAMIRRPEVFLYDEPLSNLDLELRVRLRLEIARTQRALKSTAVYVTHDQTEAMTLADQIVVLRKGRIEQVGAPLDLYRRPANLFVAGFIGTPKINLFTVERCEPEGEGTRLTIGAMSLVVPRRFEVPVATVGFRPEQVRLGAAEAGQVLFELADCETQAVEHLGDRAFCYLRSSLGELVVLAPDAQSRLSGALTLAVDAGALHFFGADEMALR